jgi:hypothetical protein
MVDLTNATIEKIRTVTGSDDSGDPIYSKKPSGLWRITLENEIIDIAASDENDAKEKVTNFLADRQEKEDK